MRSGTAFFEELMPWFLCTAERQRTRAASCQQTRLSIETGAPSCLRLVNQLGIVDAAAPYLFAINIAQSGGLAVLLWITRK